MARVKSTISDDSTTKNSVGPLKWMAPESITKHVYSRKSDSFSFGVVIYEKKILGRDIMV